MFYLQGYVPLASLQPRLSHVKSHLQAEVARRDICLNFSDLHVMAIMRRREVSPNNKIGFRRFPVRVG